MIEDFRDLGEEREISADLCIVGGGPAGIAIAREFAGGRHRVCLLESGGLDLEDGLLGERHRDTLGHGEPGRDEIAIDGVFHLKSLMLKSSIGDVD